MLSCHQTVLREREFRSGERSRKSVENRGDWEHGSTASMGLEWVLMQDLQVGKKHHSDHELPRLRKGTCQEFKKIAKMMNTC